MDQKKFLLGIHLSLWNILLECLDAMGLVALWREALPDRKLLERRTKGYKHHPQLSRFRSQASPAASIDYFLRAPHRSSSGLFL
ncbi:MAG TPA: pyrimidine dimer DNA glycosylase/endonuclease V [Candidatus Kryptonia bacterium]